MSHQPSLALGTIPFIIDGGGAVITTGVKGHLEIGFACTIKKVRVLGDVVGSITVTIKKSTYAGFPGSLASIVAAAKPTLSSAQKSEDATLTGWTTAIAEDDVLEYTVDTVATVTRVSVLLKVSK